MKKVKEERKGKQEDEEERTGGDSNGGSYYSVATCLTSPAGSACLVSTGLAHAELMRGRRA